MAPRKSQNTPDEGLQDQAESLAQTVKEKASAAAETVSEVTGTVAEQASNAIQDAARSRQARAERYLHALSSAITTGSDRLREDGYPATADYTSKAADLIEGLADEIDATDISAGARKIENVMRNKPVVSFAAALLLGFAAYRLLRPGSDAGR